MGGAWEVLASAVERCRGGGGRNVAGEIRRRIRDGSCVCVCVWIEVRVFCPGELDDTRPFQMVTGIGTTSLTLCNTHTHTHTHKHTHSLSISLSQPASHSKLSYVTSNSTLHFSLSPPDYCSLWEVVALSLNISTTVIEIIRKNNTGVYIV